MSNFEFVSCERCEEGNYVKEVAYIQLEGKYRVGFVHKIMQNGAHFWDVMGTSVTENGEKKYFKSFRFSDNFLYEDIINYLKSRKWEAKVAQSLTLDDLPF